MELKKTMSNPSGENSIDEKIMDATLRVVHEKKISGTSVRIIAKEAGVLPSSIQYYYRTKQELLVALLRSVLKTYLKERADLFDKAPQTLSDQLDVFFRQKKKVIENNRDLESVQFDFWVQNLIDETINEYFDDSYESWRENIRAVLDTFMPNLNPKLREHIPYIMLSMMQGATMQYYINDSLDLDEYFSICLDIILKMVRENSAPGDE